MDRYEATRAPAEHPSEHTPARGCIALRTAGDLIRDIGWRALDGLGVNRPCNAARQQAAPELGKFPGRNAAGFERNGKLAAFE